MKIITLPFGSPVVKAMSFQRRTFIPHDYLKDIVLPLLVIKKVAFIGDFFVYLM